MAWLQDFKAFALKGNVLDLAVGVIIGGAFGKIVSSLVADVIMPAVGLLVGGVDLTALAVTLPPLADGKPAAALKYGQFLQHVLDFVIVALAVFVFVRLLTRAQGIGKSPPAQENPPPALPTTLTKSVP